MLTRLPCQASRSASSATSRPTLLRNFIDWSLDEGQDEDRFVIETGEGWMARLIPLREELLRGDLRPLYLGWLAGVTAGDVDEDAIEPDVPTGMSQLSTAQQALAEFLGIDTELMSAAAAANQAIQD
jgi:hypothetical protein